MNGLYNPTTPISDKCEALKDRVREGFSIRKSIVPIWPNNRSYYRETTPEQREEIMACRPCEPIPVQLEKAKVYYEKKKKGRYTSHPKELRIRMPTERALAIHAAAGRNRQSVNRWVGRVLLEAIKRETERNV